MTKSIHWARWLMAWLMLVSGGELLGQKTPREANPFDQQVLKDLRDDPSYQYGKEPLPKQKEESKKENGGKSEGAPVRNNAPVFNLRGLWYVLIGVAFVIVIVWVLSRYLEWDKPSVVDPLQPMTELDLAPQTYDSLIKEAERHQNWRIAVRLYFAWVLQRLDEKGKIKRVDYKTNADYAYELSGNPLQGDFRHLARAFDYIWYGDFPVGETEYQTHKKGFQQFIQRLS